MSGENLCQGERDLPTPIAVGVPMARGAAVKPARNDQVADNSTLLLLRGFCSRLGTLGALPRDTPSSVRTDAAAMVHSWERLETRRREGIVFCQVDLRVAPQSGAGLILAG